MKKAIRVLLTVLLMACICKPGFCWDGVGHMIIAQIAYDRLTPAVKVQVNLLAAALNDDPLTQQLRPDLQQCNAITVAAWPDDIRGLHSETRQFSPWHFIDLPALKSDNAVVWKDSHPVTPHVTADDEAAVKSFGDPSISDVYLQIIAQSAILKDKSQPLADRARALAFVEHFVGDIHQPLHSIGRQLGGNQYVINPLPGADPTWQIDNLHSFWDNSYRYSIENGQIVVNPLLQTPRPTAPDTGEFKTWSDDIEAHNLPIDPGVLGRIDPADWAAESNIIATAFAFPSDDTEDLSNDYIAEASEIAKTRLALAGYRLGNLLNTLLGS